MTMKLTKAQGKYLRKQIEQQQEDRRNGIVETFPRLSLAEKKSLNLQKYS